MAERKSITEFLREADGRLKEREDKVRRQGYDVPPAPPTDRNLTGSMRARARDMDRALGGRETRLRGAEPPPVGSVAGDRPMAMYTPGREPVTYERAGLWITIGILVVLFAVFFGFLLIWH